MTISKQKVDNSGKVHKKQESITHKTKQQQQMQRKQPKRQTFVASPQRYAHLGVSLRTVSRRGNERQ